MVFRSFLVTDELERAKPGGGYWKYLINNLSGRLRILALGALSNRRGDFVDEPLLATSQYSALQFSTFYELTDWDSQHAIPFGKVSYKYWSS